MAQIIWFLFWGSISLCHTQQENLHQHHKHRKKIPIDDGPAEFVEDVIGWMLMCFYLVMF